MAEIKVLVPLDGSELAQSSLDFLPLLTAQGELNVRLIGVVDEREFISLANAEELIERECHLLSAYLDAQAQDLASKGFTASISQRRGLPAELIIQDEQHFKPDFVLIATHGRTGLERWRLGSVADKVIRGVNSKTLVIGRRPATWLNSKTAHSILVPLDGSRLAESALTVAKVFVGALQAELHIVRVVTFPAFGGLMAAMWWEQVKKEAGEYLKEKEAELAPLEPRTTLLEGDPADVLMDYLDDNQIGLVVLTSHGRGGLSRLALGSVADCLIGGPAPVLIIPDRQ